MGRWRSSGIPHGSRPRSRPSSSASTPQFGTLTGQDLVIVGVEKTGTFVTHFDEVDQTEEPGKERFDPRSYFLPTDHYIKQRIIFSDLPKRYGSDTYFGRKFFYKTQSGARIVASIPFLEREPRHARFGRCRALPLLRHGLRTAR